MATLNGVQLAAVCSVYDDNQNNVDLWFPNSYAGPVGGADEANLRTRACWNWALCAGLEANADNVTSPVRLYEETNPIDPFTDTPRAALNPGTFAGQYATEPALTALWQAAQAGGATDADKEAFMEAMARIAARANGLTPSAAPTSYSINVTVPDHEWYHWQHWALGFHNGQTRYIQTEPNVDINWGFSRVWEANRPGHLTASVYVTGIHQRHKDVIENFLSLPRCRTCQKVKPRQTTFGTRWHRCTGPPQHIFCDRCGYALAYSTSVLGIGGRSRQCNVAGCNHAHTELIDDNAR